MNSQDEDETRHMAHESVGLGNEEAGVKGGEYLEEMGESEPPPCSGEDMASRMACGKSPEDLEE